MFAGCRGVHHYERVRKIDEGTYGVVSLARERGTGQLVALKRVKMTAAAGAKDGFPVTALRETNILLALAHPNIVGMREMVVGSDTSSVYMVMEYYENDLKNVLDFQRRRNRDKRVAMLGDFGSAADEAAFAREYFEDESVGVYDGVLVDSAVSFGPLDEPGGLVANPAATLARDDPQSAEQPASLSVTPGHDGPMGDPTV